MKARIRKVECSIKVEFSFGGDECCWAVWMPNDADGPDHFNTFEEAITYATAGLVEATL